MEFDPRCFNWHYIGEDSTLWLSKDNGSSYIPIHHFDNKVTSIEVVLESKCNIRSYMARMVNEKKNI